MAWPRPRSRCRSTRRPSRPSFTSRPCAPANQLTFISCSRVATSRPANDCGSRLWKKLPTNTGCAPASISMADAACSDAPLPLNVLWVMRGEAFARSASPAPGLSWMSLASNITLPSGAAGPRSIAVLAAPVTSRSMSRTLDDRVTTPVPSGVAASPTIRNPEISAFFTSVATTAASSSVASPGSRRIAARDTRLSKRMSPFSVRRSRYSPGSTRIVVPGAAFSMAADIDSPGLDHHDVGAG